MKTNLKSISNNLAKMAINWYKIGQMPLWRMNIEFGITMMNVTPCEGCQYKLTSSTTNSMIIEHRLRKKKNWHKLVRLIMTGNILADKNKQLIYQGVTKRCLPKGGYFPATFDVTMNQKHWSNEKTALPLSSTSGYPTLKIRADKLGHISYNFDIIFF